MELTPARLDATIDALRAVLALTQPADACLRAFFRAQPGLGQRDRGVVAELVFACLRHLRLLEQVCEGRQPRRLALAAAVLAQGCSVRQLDPVLRKDEGQWLAALRARDLRGLPPAVQLSLPDWLWERLCAQSGEAEATELGRALLASAPLDLRVNAMRAGRDEVLQRLRAEGMAARPTPFAPLGIRLADKPALQKHPLFLDGSIEVQDEASQLLALVVGARRREMVVDFCAGAGGKTLALGAMMRSEGRLYAFDTSDKRLANLAPRLKRSGLSNVHPQLIDSEHDRRIARLERKIDRVLVDAPCTGLGTLRRNPDLKWRQTPGSVAQLQAKQRSILAAAARLVKPGGVLVYATCSLLREENEEIVDQFLAQAPQFRTGDASAALRPLGLELDSAPYYRVLPHRHRMDGFFAALLERAAAS
ncbi:MAG: RsmB/NOP family class I SAM-dependent RNA methyltransferase [Burkholderiales bacterium]|nr:RsmB/NOP family class I SAM-dependent RNA methyltransferase [Burkholderiales bacterium]